MSRMGWTDLLWAPIVDGAALNTSTTLTDISPTPQFSFGVNAPLPQLGQMYHVSAAGRFGTTATPTLLIGLYYGAVAGAALGVTTAITMPSTVTNFTWQLEAEFVIRTAAVSGTALTMGRFTYATAAGTTATAMIPASAPTVVTVDTTISKTLTLGAQWGASSASNTITVHQFIIGALN